MKEAKIIESALIRLLSEIEKTPLPHGKATARVRSTKKRCEWLNPVISILYKIQDQIKNQRNGKDK